MIKVKKDFDDVPASLNSKITKRKRQEHIDNGKYISGDKYNKYYKPEDVKERLSEIYNRKCVFCESTIEQFEVEHFRPKSLYWWLAYSWDNLMLICPTCNKNKTNDFDIDGVKAVFKQSDLNKIHELCKEYNKTEEPKIINPEIEDVEKLLVFDLKTGKISSKNSRVQHTIETCQLNRSFLKDERKKIFIDLMNNIKSEIVIGKPNVKVLLRSFKKTCTNEKENYLAFRRFVFKLLKKKKLSFMFSVGTFCG